MLSRRQLKEALGPLGDTEQRALNVAMLGLMDFGPDDLAGVVVRMRDYVTEQQDLMSAAEAFGVGKIAKKIDDLAKSPLLLMEAACRETSS